MTDRELLELAAKAAGYAVDWRSWDYTGFGVEDRESETGRVMPCADNTEWNPLDDDGDALRLAALLHLWEAVRLAHRLVSAEIDIYAATRLAIVRAAAEIGKAMP